jgi:hypothetical protein
MAGVTTRTPSRAVHRKRALDPWVERLHAQLNEHVDRLAPGEPLAIDVPAGTLMLEHWIVAAIHGTPDAGHEAPKERPALLAQAIALRMKIELDRAHLWPAQQARGPELYAVQADLLLDSAIGMALKREIQRVIDEEVRRGQMAPAKQWTRFRNHLNSAVSAVRQLLAESERQRADAISDKLTDEPREDQAAPDRYTRLMRRLEIEERERKRRIRMRKKARDALANLPSRTELLVASLAVTAAIWLGFVKLPDYFTSTSPVLSVNDFPRTDGFVNVEARPPSLYVTVDAQVWNGLAVEERRHLVGTISSALLASGYTGVLLSTAEGRPVAQWLALSGISLIEGDESRSVAVASTPVPERDAGDAQLATVTSSPTADFAE